MHHVGFLVYSSEGGPVKASMRVETTKKQAYYSRTRWAIQTKLLGNSVEINGPRGEEPCLE